MVEKMKYIGITGHITALNHVVGRYLSRYDIQLEQGTPHPGMEPFKTLNPYTATLQKATHFLSLLGKDAPVLHIPMEAAEAVNRVEDAFTAYEARDALLREKENQLAEIENYITSLLPYENLEADILSLEKSSYLHHRFGRLDAIHYNQYEAFMGTDERIIFVKTKQDAAYTWGVYLTPVQHAQEVDAIFASLQFTPARVTATCQGKEKSGTPAELIQHWRGQLGYLQLETRYLTEKIITGSTLANNTESLHKLLIACEKVRTLYERFDVKKYAALSRGKRVFSFTGWLSAAEAEKLEAEIADDNLVIFTQDAEEKNNATVPTRIKNLPVIRQFEFFTRLYGLPTYGEVDPTFLLAITYTLLFGVMFGDVGHGVVLALAGGFITWRYQKPLGGIITTVGISAAVFGFLYGSVFGVETLLPALWRRPTANITETLIFGMGLGVVLIALSMALYMYNTLRRGDVGEFLFSANGVTGFVFYGAVLFGVVRLFGFGLHFPLGLLVLPFLLLAFKHPLICWLEGRRVVIDGVGGFLFETFMELFETLLTYITNTISFVRVGAFAISHAGMMHVVLQLSQGAGVSGRVLILILGNLLVMGIEGLLVGIQVLRLDFYELFSRFYQGRGKAFQSNRVRG